MGKFWFGDRLVISPNGVNVNIGCIRALLHDSLSDAAYRAHPPLYCFQVHVIEMAFRRWGGGGGIWVRRLKFPDKGRNVRKVFWISSDATNQLDSRDCGISRLITLHMCFLILCVIYAMCVQIPSFGGVEHNIPNAVFKLITTNSSSKSAYLGLSSTTHRWYHRLAWTRCKWNQILDNIGAIYRESPNVSY